MRKASAENFWLDSIRGEALDIDGVLPASGSGRVGMPFDASRRRSPRQRGLHCRAFRPKCSDVTHRSVRAFAAVITGLVLTASCATAAEEKWENLFDGKSLSGWAESGFEGVSSIKVVNPFKDGRGAIIVEKGTTLSGFTWTRGGVLPRMNYEISLEAMKLDGIDFFCGLTFPVGKSACSFIVGGWGGSLVGLSNVDHSDASDNETSQTMEFVPNRWYRIRVRVTDEKIQTWIDDDLKVDLETKGRTISLRPGDIQKSLPLGFATYMTRAAVRDIRLRRL
jgi:hypothetical protein